MSEEILDDLGLQKCTSLFLEVLFPGWPQAHGVANSDLDLLPPFSRNLGYTQESPDPVSMEPDTGFRASSMLDNTLPSELHSR